MVMKDGVLYRTADIAKAIGYANREQAEAAHRRCGPGATADRTDWSLRDAPLFSLTFPALPAGLTRVRTRMFKDAAVATGLEPRIEVRGASDAQSAPVLTPAALAFVADLKRVRDAHRRLPRAPPRAPNAGEPLDFLDETRHVREGRGPWRPSRTICASASSRSPGPSTAR